MVWLPEMLLITSTGTCAPFSAISTVLMTMLLHSPLIRLHRRPDGFRTGWWR
jgi:hypothetical protein